MQKFTIALVLVLMLTFTASSVEARPRSEVADSGADVRGGIQLSFDGDLLFWEVMAEILISPRWQTRIGVVAGGVDPFDHPDEYWVINGASASTSYVLGWKKVRFLFGWGARAMVDREQWKLQGYGEIGLAVWLRPIRLSLFGDFGVEGNQGSRSRPKWKAEFMYLAGVGLSIDL